VQVAESKRAEFLAFLLKSKWAWKIRGKTGEDLAKFRAVRPQIRGTSTWAEKMGGKKTRSGKGKRWV